MPALHKGSSNYLIAKVFNTITAFGMFRPNDRVLVGVSGGPDSVALLHVLDAMGDRLPLNLAVAHLNHGLRGEASDRDESFARNLAGKMGAPFFCEQTDVYAMAAQGFSLEEAGRRARYGFFHRIADLHGFEKIALGHHADDNAESVLMYLLRGSGILGLSGISPVRNPRIVRPLIRLHRKDILRYLSENRLNWVSDASNEDVGFVRNRIRRQLIPQLQKQYNPQIIHALNRLSDLARAEETWLVSITTPLLKAATVREEICRMELCVRILRTHPVGALRRILRQAVERIKGDLRRISLAHADAAVKLVYGDNDRAGLDLPDRIRIQRNQDRLIISKEESCPRIRRSGPAPSGFCYTIDSDTRSLFIEPIGAYLILTRLENSGFQMIQNSGNSVAFMDCDCVRFPLRVRNPMPGDRFVPLGMKGRQKLKKYLINRKVPRPLRSRCPVLLSQDQIIWIGGHQIDDSVKVTSKTRHVLKIELLLA